MCSSDLACVLSNSCMNNNVEETQLAMQQDVNLSSLTNHCSSSSTTHCLMANSSSSDDNDNDNNDEEDVDDDDESFHKKGLMVLNALSKNKNAHAILFEIMETLIERGLTIKALEASLEEKGKIERDDAMEKASLEDALEEEQETRASLEEKLESIEIGRAHV